MSKHGPQRPSQAGPGTSALEEQTSSPHRCTSARDPVADTSHQRQNNFVDSPPRKAPVVNQKQLDHLSGTCRCGKVRLEAIGRPILAASCYCASCQEAGSRFERLPAAPPVLNPDGGTDYVLYRKDRVRCVTGQEFL